MTYVSNIMNFVVIKISFRVDKYDLLVYNIIIPII